MAIYENNVPQRYAWRHISIGIAENLLAILAQNTA